MKTEAFENAVREGKCMMVALKGAIDPNDPHLQCYLLLAILGVSPDEAKDRIKGAMGTVKSIREELFTLNQSDIVELLTVALVEKLNEETAAGTRDGRRFR